MTRLKRTIFSIFGMALLATGFVACSSDDANSTSTTTNESMTTSSAKNGEEVRLGIQNLYEVHDNGVYSYHKQGHFGLIVDFYNHNKSNFTY